MAGDPLHRRVHLSLGFTWVLVPEHGTSWSEWAFSPFGGLTTVGQVLTNPRTQLPEVRYFVDDEGTDGDPLNGKPKTWRWVSRCLWLRFGLRVLGVDFGVSAYYRKWSPDAVKDATRRMAVAS